MVEGQIRVTSPGKVKCKGVQGCMKVHSENGKKTQGGNSASITLPCTKGQSNE